MYTLGSRMVPNVYIVAPNLHNGCSIGHPNVSLGVPIDYWVHYWGPQHIAKLGHRWCNLEPNVFIGDPTAYIGVMTGDGPSPSNPRVWRQMHIPRA